MRKEYYKTPVLETAFHSRTSMLCQTNEWHQWKGYTTVDRYYDVELEYFSIRNSSAIFDLCPMTKYRVTGPDALPYLNRLVTREMGRVAVGRVAYSAWCNDAGQVLDDGTLFRLDDDEYRLCSQERHLDWMLSSGLGFDVDIRDETDQVAALALQGPTSCAVLRNMGLDGIENLKPFNITYFPFHGDRLMVSRTGFTGDLGYELWLSPSLAETLYDALMEAGHELGISPIGSHALEMARIEAGFIQAGVDFVPAMEAVRPGRTRSPFELGLGWLVHLKKDNFTGRAALLQEKQRGSKHRLVKLDIEGNKPAHDSFIYNSRKKAIGTVTSAMWSPICKANIALASLEAPYGEPGDELWAEIYYNRELKWTRVMARCQVVEGAFFDPPRRRATPPSDF